MSLPSEALEVLGRDELPFLDKMCGVGDNMLKVLTMRPLKASQSLHQFGWGSQLVLLGTL